MSQPGDELEQQFEKLFHDHCREISNRHGEKEVERWRKTVRLQWIPARRNRGTEDQYRDQREANDDVDAHRMRRTSQPTQYTQHGEPVPKLHRECEHNLRERSRDEVVVSTEHWKQPEQRQATGDHG